jgi:hypothetical protein
MKKLKDPNGTRAKREAARGKPRGVVPAIENGVNVTTRLPARLIAEIDLVAAGTKSNRADLIRHALEDVFFDAASH